MVTLNDIGKVLSSYQAEYCQSTTIIQIFLFKLPGCYAYEDVIFWTLQYNYTSGLNCNLLSNN